MEAGPLAEPAPPAVGERLKESLGRPWMVAVLVIAAIFLALVIAKGLHAVAQTGLNGLSLGSIYALGAVGLTLVYGILKLVNFAQGDFLTFGAYMAYLVNVTWGMPLVIGVFWAMIATALLGLLLERVLWRPMRAKHAGFLQLILMSIGLAFLLRAIIQLFWSTDIRVLDVNTTSTVDFLGLRIGQTQLIVVVVGDHRDRRDRPDAAADAARQADAGTLRRPGARRDRRHRHPARDHLHVDLRRGARGAGRGAGGRHTPTCTRSSASSCCCRSSRR